MTLLVSVFKGDNLVASLRFATRAHRFPATPDHDMVRVIAKLNAVRLWRFAANKMLNRRRHADAHCLRTQVLIGMVDHVHQGHEVRRDYQRAANVDRLRFVAPLPQPALRVLALRCGCAQALAINSTSHWLQFW